MPYLHCLTLVRAAVGSHPHLKFLIARRKHESNLRRALKQQKIREHEERQAQWENGGRSSHYLKKWGRYGGHHHWFTNGIAQAVGLMACDFEESWDDADSCYEDEHDLEYFESFVEPPCVGCRQRSCASEFCEWLSRPLEDSVKEAPEVIRSVMLATKLRVIIQNLRILELQPFVAAQSVLLPRGYGRRVQNVAEFMFYVDKVPHESGELWAKTKCNEMCEYIFDPKYRVNEFSGTTESFLDRVVNDNSYKFDETKCEQIFNNSKYFIQNCIQVEPQMDGARGEELNVISTGNVTLTEENPATSSTAARPNTTAMWQSLCSNEVPTDFSYLTDRWTLYKSYVWDNNSNDNTELTDLKLDLPWDFVNMGGQDFRDMPMFMPFNVFKYCTTDIEIKIHVNSNKFQIGQLQIAWQYMEKFDGNKLDNIYSRSQLPHVLINAGASNEATLYIPYKHILPYIRTAARPPYYDENYLGSLRTFVVAQLKSGPSGPKSCGVTFFIRFPNCKFIGMRDGAINEGSSVQVVPQMETAAAMVVAGAVVDKVIGDKNCDNKTDNSVPNYLVPTASHSWSLGTGLSEPLHNLRLVNNVQGVGRPSGIDMSETTIATPCSIFGMLKHITWSAEAADKNKYGAQLWTCDAHPQLSKDKFFKITTPGGLDSYAVPPTTVMSSMFMYWRGSIEFRFDIICSQFHTGRLLVAYIPGLTSEVANVTIQQARNCPHVEFSLQDSSSFTFVVPYITNAPVWGRKFAGPMKRSEQFAPSKLVMFVLNPLVYMESVVNYVQIVPYMRAGSDFELCVPVQPSIGLSDNVNVNYNTENLIYPTQGSYPYRVTNYNGFAEGKKVILYEGTAALGTASTFFSPSTKLPSGFYRYGKAQFPSSQPNYYWKYENSRFTDGYANVGFILAWPTDKGNYGIPFPDTDGGEKMCKKAAYYLFVKDDYVSAQKCCLLWTGTDSNDSSSDLSKLRFTTMYDNKLISDEDWVMVVPQMDDRFVSPNLLNPVTSLTSTGHGSTMFNENFSDMKDYMRRYQLYYQTIFNLNNKWTFDDAFAVVPILPGGLPLDIDSPRSIFNQVRDGPIPIMCNGYMFYRGSLRMRIIVNGGDSDFKHCSFWVQHQMDGDLESDGKPRVYPNLDYDDKMRCHGYGFYVQSARVNNIIEIEVPFYQPGMYGFSHKLTNTIQNTDLYRYYSLGNLIIGCNTTTVPTQAISLTIYYSIGDDFSLSTFRGFVPVVWADEVWPDESKKNTVRVRPQMDDQCVEPEMFSSFMSSVAGSIGGKVLSSAFSTPMSTLKESIVTAGVAEVEKIAKPHIESLKCDVNLMRVKFEDEMKQFYTTTGLTSAFGNLMHCMINPTIQTVAVSVANILLTFVAGSIHILTSLTSALTNFFSKTWHLFDNSSTSASIVETTFVQPEGMFDMGDTELKVLISLIFTAICTVVGVTCSQPETKSTYFSLLRDINVTASLSNNILVFVRNCSDLIVYLFKYVASVLDPRAKLEALLDDTMPDIKQWFKECTYLLDARNKERYVYDKAMMSRIYDAAAFGAIMVSNGIEKHLPGGKILWDTYKEIVKLRNDLIERGIHPDVRFECFPIYFAGPPGCGKSSLTTRFVNEILRSINHRQKGSLIYNIDPGLKFWTGVQNPAALVSDDMYQVSGTMLEAQVATLFTVCSTSVLNPPMAAVEDKERRINPLLYIMHCNYAFPDLTAVARCKEAIYRRRKFLIDVDYTDEMKQQFPEARTAEHLPVELVRDILHLKFRLAINPAKEDTEWGPWMTYAQMLEIVRGEFGQWYIRERENFRRRMVAMYSLDPDFQEDNLLFEMPELQEIPSLGEQIRRYREVIHERLLAMEQEGDGIVADYIRKFKRFTENFGFAYPEAPDDHFTTRFADENFPCFEEYFGSDRTPENVRAYVIGRMRYIARTYDASIVENDNFQRRWCEYLQGRIRTENGIPSTHDSVEDVREFLQGIQGQAGVGDAEAYWSAWCEHVAMDPEFRRVVFRNGMPNITAYCAASMQFPHFSSDLETEVRVESVRTPFEFAPPIPYAYTYYFDEFLDIGCLFSGNTKPMPFACIRDHNSLRNYLKSVLYNYHNLTLHKKLNSTLNEAALVQLVMSMEKKIRENTAMEDDNALNGLWGGVSVSFYIKNILRWMQRDNIDADAAPAYIAEKIKQIRSRLDFMLPSGGLCAQDRIYYEMLENLDTVSYCASRKSYFYKNAFGLKKQFLCHEVARSGFYNNNMFRHLFNVCYNLHHRDDILAGRMDANETVFTAPTRETIESLTKSWSSKLKCWWSHSFTPFIGQLIQFIINVLPTIIALLLSFLAVMGIKAVVGKVGDMFSGAVEDSAEKTFNPEGANYYKFDMPKHTKDKFKASNKPTGTKTFPEASADQRYVLAKKIENNTVLLKCSFLEGDNKRVLDCRCLMMYGRQMLVLKHYIEQFNAARNREDITNLKFELMYRINNKPGIITLTDYELLNKIHWCDFSGDKSKSNFGLLSLPKHCLQFKSLIPHIATRAMLGNLCSTVDIYSPGDSSAFDMPFSSAKNYTIVETNNSSEVFLEQVYIYSKHKSGMCGSVLVNNAVNYGNGGIIGIHVAGSNTIGKGVAEPIYREMFEQAKAAIPDCEPMNVVLKDYEENKRFDLEGNMVIYGCVDDKLAHHESGKTKIIPSLIAGHIYPVRTEVNPLAPNDPRQPPGSHPLRDGCNKHGSGKILPFEYTILQDAKIGMMDTILCKNKPVRHHVKPLTLQQAVCGDVSIPHFESLNWKSSEGFPLSSERPKDAHDKRWLFNLSEGEFGYKLESLHPKLEQEMYYRDKLFEKNMKPPTIYVDCLKDYRLSPEKCKIPGKTRIFSIAPIQCTLDCRMYLGDFCASFKSSKIENGCGIGINPDSLEWTQLVNYLFEVGDKIITLDYKNFGPCLMSQVVAVANELIVLWHARYGASKDHIDRVRWILDNDILNPVHLCDNIVYQTLNGIASGSPVTGELNSIPNLLYIRCIYLEIMKDHLPDYASMWWFNSLVRVVVYGDDLIMSVHETIVDVFNAIKIREYFAKHGIEVTSADKDTELQPYGDIYEATFLKRSFVPHPTRKGVWLAPVNHLSVEECLNWMGKDNDQEQATIENARASVDLAYGHGPTYYNRHRCNVLKALSDIKLTANLKTWYERDAEVFDDPKQPVDVDQFNVISLPWYYNRGDD